MIGVAVIVKVEPVVEVAVLVVVVETVVAVLCLKKRWNKRYREEERHDLSFFIFERLVIGRDCLLFFSILRTCNVNLKNSKS